LHNQGPLESSLLSDIISTAVQASKKIFAKDALVVEDSLSAVDGQQQQTVETTTLLQDQFLFR
jgi:hypothetical protein